MFVFRNAWKSVTRNKGRNILIIVIVTIIAAAATIGLSIRQAAATARTSGLENTTVTAQISLDRSKLISESRQQTTTDSDSSQQMGGPMRSTASDPANAIYTSVSTLKSLGLDADADSDSAAQLSYTYVCSSKSDYETFAKDVKKAGLSSDYTVSSADVENYESSLVPLNNLSKFALTLLIVVLSVGAVVLVVITLLNVRERKYEIGVLTAIGVNKVKVAAQFSLELLIVTMIGLAVGAGVGAAVSVPVSNQLLASQVEQQQSQQSSQREQFGRDMAKPGDSNDSKNGSDSGDGSTTAGENKGDDGTSHHRHHAGGFPSSCLVGR
ncbi:ABC transporter permease [Bifidobacterium ruminantium]|uniref:FtsX-like permease family protein n=1 Tax=Bifidobacterium ruminantium TaxID=78346 RepID=UPI00195A2A50|nr:ABC transporter permease [Bifidobacterium ruminantium]MBM6746701.1 ABC transporter permease [Bifidobacterium ruminantium]